MKIAIIGQGYVGLPIAIQAANSGFNVLGFDIDNTLVVNLNSAISHIKDVSNADIKKVIDSGNFHSSSNPTELQGAEIVVIAVPTPLDDLRQPDLSFLENVCNMLGNYLFKRALIINESTSYPGTLRNFISARIEGISAMGHYYAISPERVDPGNINWNISNTPRIFSGLTPEASQKTKDFYGKFCNNLVEVSSPEVAEAAKLFENTFRQVNIALVNEFALATRSLGIPIREVLEASASKPYGFMKFNPGLGVGGHCIPVDPSYFSFAAANIGASTEFINLANRINLEMPNKIVAIIAKEIGVPLTGKKILVCGISYKPNIADIRESPSLRLVNSLIELGAEVSWHDPVVKTFNGEVSVKLPSEHFDLAILAVAHDQMDLEAVYNCAEIVFDCVGKIPEAIQL
ncbi:WecC UDP-N-acetyl-D-mannosaminuronate dehydrogenase [actinobacterium SCGC AAA044-D11]